MIETIYLLADQFETVANLLLAVGAAKVIYGYRWVTINLTCGQFKVRAKDIDLPNLTALTSKIFFGGGWLPDNIRHELIAITNPSTKDVVIYEKK